MTAQVEVETEHLNTGNIITQMEVEAADDVKNEER